MVDQDLILYRLDELKSEVQAVRSEQEAAREVVVKVREEIAGLKIKSGLWGAVAGAFPAGAAALYWLLKG